MLKTTTVADLYIRRIQAAKTCGEVHKIYSRMKSLLIHYAARYGSYSARQIRNLVLTDCYKRILAAELLLGGMRKN